MRERLRGEYAHHLGYFDGCSSLANLEVAVSWTGADIEANLQNMGTVEDAALRLHGLADAHAQWADPFAVPETAPAPACRVNAAPAEFAGPPTVDPLVAVLAAHEYSP